MKKALSTFVTVLSLFAVIALTLSLAACGGKENPAGAGDSSDGQAGSGIESPLELLTQVWNGYGDDDKFPAIGGDLSEEHMTDGAPGIFGVDDADMLDATLGFPAASAGQIDGAASLIHMMNANTCTGGAFHAADAGAAAELSAAIKDNVMQRQWMCGFPEKLVIVTVDDYIVSFFGTGSLTEKFKTQLTAAYGSAEVRYDEPVM